MRYQTKSQEWQLRLLSEKCYGYDKDKNGELVINKEQAEVVKLIFDLYLGGGTTSRKRTHKIDKF